MTQSKTEEGKTGGVRSFSEADRKVVWIVVVGEAPCTRAFLLLGGGRRLVSSGSLERSFGLHGGTTCGEALATKSTVSERRSVRGALP